jgi:hypothetical protein
MIFAFRRSLPSTRHGVLLDFGLRISEGRAWAARFDGTALLEQHETREGEHLDWVR